MVPVSGLFKEKIQDNSREFKLEIQIAHKAGTLNLTDADVKIGTFVFHESTQSEDTFTIGGVCASHVSFTLLMRPSYENIVLMGSEVRPRIGLHLGDDIYEFVDLGIFYIDSIDPNINTLEIMAMDGLIQFDIPYINNRTYPMAVRNILHDICEQCDVEWSGETYQNMNYEVPEPIKNDNLSCRDMLSYIAVISGTFAKLTRAGILTLRWYEGTDLIVGPNNRNSFLPRGDTVGVRGIKYINEEDGEEEIFLEGNDLLSLDVTGNPLMQHHFQDLIFAIFASVKDISFIPYECKWQGNPAVQAGDVVTQRMQDGTDRKTLVTSSEYKYRGVSTLKGEGLPEIAQPHRGTIFKQIGDVTNISGNVIPVNAPAPITEFEVGSGGSGNITLKWLNPVDTSFDKVKIVWKYDRMPQHYNDGTTAYEGSRRYVDLDGMRNGVAHYFRAFTFNRSGEMNDSITGQTAIGTPVGPDPSPGADYVIAGDMNAGYFGEVSSAELFSGDELALAVGITQGVSQFSDEGWLKFAIDGKVIFKSKKPIRHSISWNHIQEQGCVYGDLLGTTVSKNGITYKVRLMRGANKDPAGARGGVVNHGSEWNRLMLPIHERAKEQIWQYENNVNVPTQNWGIDFSNEDLHTSNTYGDGSSQWCQEVADNLNYRISRGRNSVSTSGEYSASYTHRSTGWSPVLEAVYTKVVY